MTDLAVDSIRHIFFDLDGTLIGGNGAVKDEVWQALEPVRQAGVGLSVCTGRTHAGVAQRVARKLSPDGLHIFENGGVITPADGEPVALSALDESDLKRLADRAYDIGATIEFYTIEGIFTSKLDADCAEHARALDIEVEERDLYEVIADVPVVRAHWIVREHLIPFVVTVMFDNAEMGLASSPVLRGMHFGSVTRKGTSKGSAAARVADELGFDLADAVGIGDAPGDEPLLQAVGYPFVVDNAPPELRFRYDVLGDVDEDGVLPLLRRWV